MYCWNNFLTNLLKKMHGVNNIKFQYQFLYIVLMFQVQQRKTVISMNSSSLCSQPYRRFNLHLTYSNSLFYSILNQITISSQCTQKFMPKIDREKTNKKFSPEYFYLIKKLNAIYRVIQEESARLQEMIVCVILSKKVHMNMGPILNGYGVMTA